MRYQQHINVFLTSFGCSLINTPPENWLTLGSAMNGLIVTGIAVGFFFVVTALFVGLRERKAIKARSIRVRT
jgi:hypothetical protein